MRFAFFIVFYILSLCALPAQTLAEARQMYLNRDYIHALPLFEAEYLKKPNDPSLNQWLGVCIYETGGDLDRAEELLIIASKKKIRDSFYYLTLINAEKTRPDLALNYLTQYQSELKKKYGKTKAQLADDAHLLDESILLEHQLNEMERMVTHIQDVVIIDSIVVRKEELLSAYHLSPLNGELGYFGEFGNIDNMKDAYSTMFFTENRHKVYFSEPDSVGMHNIYSLDKLPDGYGNKRLLFPDRFGFDGDMMYPYVMADGLTIIFAAKDSKGLGGLNLYITRYNTSTNKYLKPEMLNMPFNNFSNDFLYVVDEDKQLGWFASDRGMSIGSVCVYTFIPNENNTFIQDNDVVYLANRAKINRLKDTWKPDTDYSDLIALGRKDIKPKEQNKKDFEFIINDYKTYYTLTDFVSVQARDLFKKLMEGQNKLIVLRNTLNSKREQLLANPQADIDQREILGLENQELKITHEIEEMEKEVRLLESKK